VPDSVLTILKFCFLALLYLFFVRVLRAVWVEVSGRAPTARTVAANYGSTPTARPTRSRVGDMRAAVGGKNGTKLKVIEPPETRGTVYELTDELTMGRATGCHITLDDTYVSQLHARVFKRDGQVFIEDHEVRILQECARQKHTALLPVRELPSGLANHLHDSSGHALEQRFQAEFRAQRFEHRNILLARRPLPAHQKVESERARDDVVLMELWSGSDASPPAFGAKCAAIQTSRKE